MSLTYRLLTKRPFPSLLSTLRSLPLLPKAHHCNRLSSSSTTPKTPQTRLTTLLSRLPPRLRNYTTPLLTAPISHITSFLILHELTAIIPLVGLTFTFHYTSLQLPASWTEGRYVREGVERFGRWFGRRGWFGFSPPASTDHTPTDTSLSTTPATLTEAGEEGGKVSITTVEEVEQKWHVNAASGRILVEVATAYAITKVFLPARVVLSVWATPWFARVVLGRVGGLIGRKKVRDMVGKSVTKEAAGTGATGGGVLGRKR